MRNVRKTALQPQGQCSRRAGSFLLDLGEPPSDSAHTVFQTV